MFQWWENMEINRWSNAWIKKVKYYYFKPFRWLQFFTEILTKSMFFPIEKYTIQLFKLTIFSDFLMLFPDMTVVPPMSALPISTAIWCKNGVQNRFQYNRTFTIRWLQSIFIYDRPFNFKYYVLSRVYCRFQTKHFLDIKKIALVVRYLDFF